MIKQETPFQIVGESINSSINISIAQSFLSTTNKSAFYHGEMQGPVPRAVTLKFSTTGFIDNEYRGLSILHAHNVRVPEPIALVERDELPQRGIVMKRIYGQELSDVSSPKLREQLGREVRKMNDIKVPGFGFITNGVAQFTQAQEYIESEMLVAKVPPAFWNVVRKDIAAQPPHFSHQDIKERNVMVDQAGDIVIHDLEYWKGSDALYDVGGYLFYLIRSGKPLSDFNDFMRGYTAGEKLDDTEKLRILFYAQLVAGKFVDLVSRVDPLNIAYAQVGWEKMSAFIEKMLA